MAGYSVRALSRSSLRARFRLTALPIFLLAVMPMRGAAPPRFMQ